MARRENKAGVAWSLRGQGHGRDGAGGEFNDGYDCASRRVGYSLLP